MRTFGGTKHNWQMIDAGVGMNATDPRIRGESEGRRLLWNASFADSLNR
jgi:hypothetical protein